MICKSKEISIRYVDDLCCGTTNKKGKQAAFFYVIMIDFLPFLTTNFLSSLQYGKKEESEEAEE